MRLQQATPLLADLEIWFDRENRLVIDTIKTCVRIYYEFHSYQRQNNRTLAATASSEGPATILFPMGRIECQLEFGGLMKNYHRVAV